MPRKSNPRNSRAPVKRIMDVRLADSAAGADGLRVDRMIAHIKTTESQCRILIGDFVDLSSSSTADTLGTYGFDNIFGTDDFTSMVAQFNLFRVEAIKFDIIDVNTNTTVFNTWGVWHDNYESSIPAYTRANVTDLPDSRVISPGTGLTTLYWVAHGTAEQQFQQGTTAGSVAQRFGGLKYFIGASGAGAKYQLIVHAVVDFRGRK